jgi:exodeoxyribonuclease VII small subunit
VPKKTTPAADYSSLNLELSDVLARLQQPDIQVDEAVKLYEAGLQLVDQLEAHLKSAENTVKKLKLAQPES